ncbi:MAG: hypothetical protein JXX28_15440 [Deltaproteobacteria bacterium]|nr:hypothetical protein [Deltaproteobacteria bacterium]
MPLWLPVALLASALAQDPSTASSAQPLTAERLQDMRAYRTEHLRVSSYSELVGGGSNMSPTLGVGLMQVGTDPIRTVRSWAIYQGPAQMPVPAFYRAVGDVQTAELLEGRIQSHRIASNLLYGVGLASGLATAFSVYAMSHETSADQLITWQRVATTGLVGMVVGLSAGGLPASRAERLVRDPSVTLTPGEAQRMADGYNEALRVRLGMNPEDAARVELSEGGN